MAWIKRNLFFVIGSAVALALMGCAVWYLLSKWSANEKTQLTLEETYAQLQELTDKKPAPGVQGGKTDNQKLAQEQIQQLKEINRKLRAHFIAIQPIPNSVNVTGAEFATTLPVAIDQLMRSAAAASVALPQRYSFSFQVQRALPKFAPSSLGPLSVQLGEVKAICDVLFGAKINYLASIRREKVSTDDDAGTLADYLEEKSTVNGMATLTPYEVTFHCFGSELASVLSGFASSPYCFVVRTMNVEPATEVSVSYDSGTVASPSSGAGTREEFRTSVATAPTVATTAGSRGGLPTFLDEKQIKVTLMLVVVKLNPNPKQ